MAQASSAQREPSMEEILASIRRIIEDSDTARKEGEALSSQREPALRAVEPAGEAPVEVDAFRAELRPAAETKAEETDRTEGAVSEKKPVTLAEVQAQLAQERLAAARPGEIASAAQSAMVRGFSELYDDEDKVEPAASVDDPVDPPDEQEEDMTPAPAAEKTSAAEPQSQKQSIISEMAGRQVAAAFSELSEAFAASRRRSFDEMAEEMLRPMLQDWLDNNLPTLVERLVREEIERVARGV
jgi:cell pole-organizing protein PopZ